MQKRTINPFRARALLYKAACAHSNSEIKRETRKPKFQLSTQTSRHLRETRAGGSPVCRCHTRVLNEVNGEAGADTLTVPSAVIFIYNTIRKKPSQRGMLGQCSGCSPIFYRIILYHTISRQQGQANAPPHVVHTHPLPAATPEPPIQAWCHVLVTRGCTASAA